jgi:hypothetical protein
MPYKNPPLGPDKTYGAIPNALLDAGITPGAYMTYGAILEFAWPSGGGCVPHGV